jgi:hypothetical protein
MPRVPKPSDLLARIGRAIQSFTESPITNLVKGLLLLLIGLSEASHTLREDVENMKLRVGHGIVIIGFFSILDTLPKFIEGIEASKRYVDYRKRKTTPTTGTTTEPEVDPRSERDDSPPPV